MATARDLISDLVERIHGLEVRLAVLENNRRANAAIVAAVLAFIAAIVPQLLPYCHAPAPAPQEQHHASTDLP